MEIGDATLAEVDQIIEQEIPQNKSEHTSMAYRSSRRKASFWKNRKKAAKAYTLQKTLGTRSVFTKLRIVADVRGDVTSPYKLVVPIQSTLTLHPDWTRYTEIYSRIVVSSLCVHYTPVVYDQGTTSPASGSNIKLPPLYVGYDPISITDPANQTGVLQLNKWKVFNHSSGTQKWAFKLGQAGSQIQPLTGSYSAGTLLGYLKFYMQDVLNGIQYGAYVLEYNCYFLDKR